MQYFILNDIKIVYLFGFYKVFDYLCAQIITYYTILAYDTARIYTESWNASQRRGIRRD